MFLSHAHQDEALAIALADYLYANFGLTTFIDSLVWGYAEDLLWKIDTQFCKTTDGFYDNQKRSYSTSHVHMMLATVLAQMIDNIECVIYLNTPSSFSSRDTVENKTKSPWIYPELSTTVTVRRKRPGRTPVVLRKALGAKLPVFRYTVSLGHLPLVNEDGLVLCSQRYQWVQQTSGDVHPLDVLYDMFRIID